MFYKFIDENTIERAPKPLSVNGKDIFTNSETIHNEKGYYRLVSTEYPQDENSYVPIYKLDDSIITQNWVLCAEEGEAWETKL